MVDDLLECTGDEEDPFALDRYVDVSRDPTFGHTTQPSQGHTHASGPATQPTAASSSPRLTPQMGVTALKMIPESKAIKSPETRRSGDSGSRPASAKQEAVSQSPKGHLLDLHLGRKHKRTPSGSQCVGEHHTNKSGESPNMSPRQGKEGAQSPKGIRLDLHITRRHKRSLSCTQAGSEAQHSKAGDSPNMTARVPSGRTEGASPKGNFLDIHGNHRHDRFSSGGQGTVDSAIDRFCESPATSSEQLAKDASPTSDRKFLSFLKTHIPFVSSPAQSPGINLRCQGFPNTTPEEEAPRSGPLRHSGHVRHSSDLGRTTAFHHQSAPPTPSKMQNRLSADLSGPPQRPSSIVVDGNRVQEGLWDL